MDISIRWGFTCDGLVSHPGGVNDSHPRTTTETRDKHRTNAYSWLGKRFNLFNLIITIMYMYVGMRVFAAKMLTKSYLRDNKSYV